MFFKKQAISAPPQPMNWRIGHQIQEVKDIYDELPDGLKNAKVLKGFYTIRGILNSLCDKVEAHEGV